MYRYAVRMQQMDQLVVEDVYKRQGAGFAARCLAADYLYPNGGASAAQVRCV